MAMCCVESEMISPRIARIVRSGGASTENTKPIYDIVKRAPLTTKQFVEDHKALFT
jgi:hypothetical protein